MVVHELGHVLAAWLTGGTVSSIVLHPLRISWTGLSDNPHPQVVAWGGSGLGVGIPLLFCVLGKRLRLPHAYCLNDGWRFRPVWSWFAVGTGDTALA